ncbi:MAG TPA: hypothetical protein VM450_14265 [Thermomicrobiales bacterium]|nr:hypothetical protein [Thermomicrobiales bacterium]
MLDSYRDLIDGLTEESTTLRELLGTPVPDDLAPEVLALLREVRGREAAVLRRSQSVMRKENVNLRPIEDEPEVANAADAGEAPEALMSAFVHDRGELVSLLMNLTLKDWERPVHHRVLGETTLSDEIEDHLTWEEDMLERFRGALAAG